MARRTAMRLAALGGLLLVLAHASASSTLLLVGAALARAFLPADIAALANLAFAVMFFVAGLGGIAVLLGAWAWKKRWARTGNLLVDLGAGTGLIGLTLLAAVSVLSGSVGGFLVWLLGPAGIGVLLTIWARHEAG